VYDPYRELFERSSDAILFIEGEMFVDCNDAAVKMLRCRNRAEVLSTHPSELSPETQPDGRSSFEKASEMIAMAFQRGSHRFEWEHVRADGEVFPVEVLLTAVGDRLHVVWRELGARKQLEAKLREAQKMEVVGRLAAGVAHDFNNLLVVILGSADLLCTLLEPGTDEVRLAAEIHDAGERGSHLVKRLLALGRKQQLMPSTMQLASVVDDLAGLVRRLLGPDIPLKVQHGESVTISADRGQLEQAILNLATNSRDAMPTGGEVVITTGVCEAELATTFGLPALGRFGFLRVQDTGEGMDTATLARALEPFFTTKPTGTGTGLGLASVESTVSQSGGFVRITSEFGRGTAVGLYWPLDYIVEVPPPSEVEHPIDERIGTSLAGVRILLVEDEDPVATFVERTLHENGCVLTRANNGQHALTLFDANPNFDMILSDVIMPVMGGPPFILALRERNIEIPVVFMSGYTNDAIAAAGLGTGAVLLEKPFSPWELRRAVRRATRRG
jgi:two-component system cell cycle sensor histidine kinase/response regulator CckA